MRILVTGAAGAVGRVLCENFQKDGHEVIALIRPTGRSIPPCSRVVRCDLGEQVPFAMPVDLIVHAAGQTPQSSDQSPVGFVRSNVRAMEHIVDFARQVKPRLIIFFSSLSVYGDVVVERLSETTPFNKPGLYGATKYLGELILAASKIPAVSLRLPGIVGPGCLAPWLGQTLSRLARGEDVTIFNPSSDFNNIVDTHELRRLIYFLYENISSGHEALTVGAPRPEKIQDIVSLMALETDSRSKIKEGDSAKAPFSIDITKLSSLGFELPSTRDLVTRLVNENRNILCA